MCCRRKTFLEEVGYLASLSRLVYNILVDIFVESGRLTHQQTFTLLGALCCTKKNVANAVKQRDIIFDLI